MRARRVSLLLCSAVGVSLALASCTSEPGPPPEPTASPSRPGTSGPAQEVTLRLGVHGDATLRGAWSKVARAYGNEHPEVTVEVQTSRTPEQAMRRVSRQAGTGEAPDLFIAPSEYAPALSAADVVQPVDELLESRGVVFGDNYLRLGLEAFSAEQHLQCMPYDVSPLVVFYNRGLTPFNRLVEPGGDPLTPETGWTWEQFTQAVELMSGGRMKGVYVEPELRTVMALVRSAGEDVVDDPREATSLTLSDDGTRGALEDILDVLREDRLTPTAEQLRRKDALARFADEQVGMLLATRAVVPELRASGVDFDVYPLPTLGSPGTVADVTGLCMSADTQHRDAAADLLAFATGERGATILAEGGAVVPSHVPTLNSLAFTQPGAQPESVRVFADAVALASVHPYVLGWPELVERVRPELEQLFYDRVIAFELLLARIDEESRQVLREAREVTDPVS